MYTRTIDPHNLLPHGAVRIREEEDAICLTVTRTLNTRFQNYETPMQSFLQFPEKLHIPFTLRLRVSLDIPALYIRIGKGHIALPIVISITQGFTSIPKAKS